MAIAIVLLDAPVPVARGDVRDARRRARGVFISQLILAAVSEPIGIPDFATTIAVMLGLGAGIDYALVIFSRFREQLAAGDSAPRGRGAGQRHLRAPRSWRRA